MIKLIEHKILKEESSKNNLKRYLIIALYWLDKNDAPFPSNTIGSWKEWIEEIEMGMASIFEEAEIVLQYLERMIKMKTLTDSIHIYDNLVKAFNEASKEYLGDEFDSERDNWKSINESDSESIEDYKTGEKIKTPRGIISVIDITVEKAKEFNYYLWFEESDYWVVAGDNKAFLIKK